MSERRRVAVLPSLANERSHLAWQRTAMSWGGAGAVVTRYFAEDGLVTAADDGGVLMIVVGALMWLDGAAATTAPVAIRRRAVRSVAGDRSDVVWSPAVA